MRPPSRFFSIIIFLALTAALLYPSMGLATAQVSAAMPVPENGSTANPYYTERALDAADGESLTETIINGPAKPPAGFEAQNRAVSASELSVSSNAVILDVPAYDWVFGCSAVSGSMIAAYYDRNGYANMYTGPTNGGVMPMNNSIWGTWSDGYTIYPLNPLTASKNGLDGRVTKGSIDDYWVSYGSSTTDPYISGGWAQHTFGDAIGDYMRTSQSTFSNSDGSTSFYNWTSSSEPLTCVEMESAYDGNYGMNVYQRDGTYGRKLFYEARGYTVTDCYNQKTNNNGGGFTYDMYKAEIDAGRPVMINLAGHTVVGVGYDSVSSTVYIHDTWDYNIHSMTWGGSYDGMALRSVSIVNLAMSCSVPAVPILSTPASGAVVETNQPVFDWSDTANATRYDFQLDDAVDFATPLTSVSGLTSSTYTYASALTAGTYYWRVRGLNYAAGGCNIYGAWRIYSFTVSNAPGSFSKVSPLNNSGSASQTATLSWEASTRVVNYEYCYDTTNDDLCSHWLSTTATSVTLSGLDKYKTYYWHVRAVNLTGTTMSRDGWYSFAVWGQTYLPVVSK